MVSWQVANIFIWISENFIPIGATIGTVLVSVHTVIAHVILTAIIAIVLIPIVVLLVLVVIVCSTAVHFYFK